MKNMNAKTLVFRTMFKFYVGTQPKLCWTNIYLKFLYTFFLDIDTLFALNKMSCGICETTFSDDIDDDAHCPKPKILSCLHILCTVCLADRIQVVPEENVVLTICPICSTPTIKPLPADYLQREENNLVSRTISYDSDMSVSHVDTTPTQYYPSQVESTYGGEMDTSVYSDLPDELLDMYNEGEEAPHYEDIYIQNDRIDDSTELDHDGDGYSQDDDLQSHKSQESAVSDSRDRAGGAKSELVALAHWTLVFIDLIIILSVCIYRFIGDSIFAENSVIQIRASAETQTMVCALLLTHLLLQEMSSSSLFTGYHQIADATQEDNNIVSVLLVAADVAAVVSLLVAAVGSSVSLVCQIIAQELLNYLHLPSISTADVVMGIAGVAMISSALYHALYDDSPPESTYSQQKANPFATPTVPAAAKFTSPPQSNQSNQTSRFISTTSTNRSSGNRSRQSLQSHRQSQRYTSPEAGRGVNSASSRTPPQRTSLSPKVTPMDNPLRKVTFRPPARTRGAAVAADISVDLDYADIYGPSSGEGGGGRGRGGRDKAASASIFGSDGRSRRASPPLEELLQQAFHEGEDGVVGTVTPSASRQAEQRVNSAQKAHVKAQAAAEAIRLERLQHTGQQALLIQAQEQAAVATAAEEARVALEQARLRQEALIALEQERAVREASEKLAEQLAKSARPPVLSPPRSIHRADRHTPR